MAKRIAKSKGHIGFIAHSEYFCIESGDMYSATKANTIDLNTGYRVGARFECTGINAITTFSRMAKDYRNALRRDENAILRELCGTSARAAREDMGM